MLSTREYDVVHNFRLVETFKTLKEAEDFIKDSNVNYDIMVVDTPTTEVTR